MFYGIFSFYPADTRKTSKGPLLTKFRHGITTRNQSLYTKIALLFLFPSGSDKHPGIRFRTRNRQTSPAIIPDEFIVEISRQIPSSATCPSYNFRRQKKPGIPSKGIPGSYRFTPTRSLRAVWRRCHTLRGSPRAPCL